MKDYLVALQTYFLDWGNNTTSSGDIQFGDNTIIPNEDWIKLDIETLNITNKSYTGDLSYTIGVYVSVYNSNQIKASEVVDELNAFFENTKIPFPGGTIQVLNHNLVTQRKIVGEEINNGLYLIRVMYKAQVC